MTEQANSPVLTATVVPIFGAARALPGLTAEFDLAPYLRAADARDISSLRAAGWSQDGDGDFLMDAVLNEDHGPKGEGDVSHFMSQMEQLREAEVSDVCWRVSVEPAAAEAFLKLCTPAPAVEPNLPHREAPCP